MEACQDPEVIIRSPNTEAGSHMLFLSQKIQPNSTHIRTICPYATSHFFVNILSNAFSDSYPQFSFTMTAIITTTAAAGLALTYLSTVEVCQTLLYFSPFFSSTYPLDLRCARRVPKQCSTHTIFNKLFL